MKIRAQAQAQSYPSPPIYSFPTQPKLLIRQRELNEYPTSSTTLTSYIIRHNSHLQKTKLTSPTSPSPPPYAYIQLLPQIFINHRRHNTTGLQPSMMILWATAGVPLGVYNIVERFNIALRIQPQILTLLSLVTWMQCMYYSLVSLPSSIFI